MPVALRVPELEGRRAVALSDGFPEGCGFEPLRQVPEDRTVVLGLVSSKKANLESKSELKERITAASRFLPLERLALSPQCGFASTQEGNLLTFEDEEAKLRLVAETAQEVWGQAAPVAQSAD